VTKHALGSRSVVHAQDALHALLQGMEFLAVVLRQKAFLFVECVQRAVGGDQYAIAGGILFQEIVERKSILEVENSVAYQVVCKTILAGSYQERFD